MASYESIVVEGAEKAALERLEAPEVDGALEDTAKRIESTAAANEDVRPHLDAAAEGLRDLVCRGAERWADGLTRMAGGAEKLAPELGGIAEGAAEALKLCAGALRQGVEAIRENPEVFDAAVRLVLLASAYAMAPEIMVEYLSDRPELLTDAIKTLLESGLAA